MQRVEGVDTCNAGSRDGRSPQLRDASGMRGSLREHQLADPTKLVDAKQSLRTRRFHDSPVSRKPEFAESEKSLGASVTSQAACKSSVSPRALAVSKDQFAQGRFTTALPVERQISRTQSTVWQLQWHLSCKPKKQLSPLASELEGSAKAFLEEDRGAGRCNADSQSEAGEVEAQTYSRWQGVSGFASKDGAQSV